MPLVTRERACTIPGRLRTSADRGAGAQKTGRLLAHVPSMVADSGVDGVPAGLLESAPQGHGHESRRLAEMLRFVAESAIGKYISFLCIMWTEGRNVRLSFNHSVRDVVHPRDKFRHSMIIHPRYSRFVLHPASNLQLYMNENGALQPDVMQAGQEQ